jgi:hypothetical protein
MNTVSDALAKIKKIQDAIQLNIEYKVYVDATGTNSLRIEKDALKLLKDEKATVVINANGGTFSFSTDDSNISENNDLFVNFEVKIDADNKAGKIKFELMSGDKNILETKKDFKVVVPMTATNIFKLVPQQFGANGELENVKLSRVDTLKKALVIKSINVREIVLTEEIVTLNDLDKMAWAKGQIEFLAARNIAKGMPNGSFAGEKQITRAEFITLIVKTFNLSVDNATSNYTDVKSSDWYYNAVSSANAFKLVTGFPNGEFKPNAPITRGHMAIIVEKVLRLQDRGTVEKMTGLETEIADEYIDNGLISSYNKMSVGIVSELGIMTGYPDKTFASSKNANRAEAAVMISNILNKL